MMINQMVPLDIEIRHLAAFRAVCEHRSFGRAAAALGYSQAAISQQIAALEAAVGTALFHRPGGPRPVEPTEAARLLLPHADAIFRQLDAARTTLDDVAGGIRGRLAIGSFESVSVALLPRIVAVLTSERPDLELQLTEHHEGDRLVSLVLDGELDASFVPETPAPGAELEARELLVDPYVAVVPVDHPGSVLTLEQLADLPLVGHADDDTCQVRVNVALQALRVAPHYVFRSSDNGALQAMVRAGLGVAVMPLLAVDTDDPGVRIVPLQPPIPPRHVTLVWRSGRPAGAALGRFIEIVDDIVDQISMQRAS